MREIAVKDRDSRDETDPVKMALAAAERKHQEELDKERAAAERKYRAEADDLRRQLAEMKAVSPVKSMLFSIIRFLICFSLLHV
jgi:hypothetical protein